ncbi:ATP-dependent zinc metalloprotease FtsH [Candidatus Phytoplasma melaleucae]|uniref:ATP-dependent zinc metalloprotease FtsH n=1 Tax=Candidatus Phytoplasma melaleucae TaxID=2982630 RepID=A0ABT9DDM0_9MOLU|nr:ATP-dependent zinc metalloprotease FtsH ['Melaleuca sp.' phytoplasma]MDO8167944.1 ATP-dependent zinc metalloprotease FtsH ['Melaleuca sp.' phytoplasma]
MKKLPYNLDKISIWHVIIIILLVGFFTSLYNKLEQKIKKETYIGELLYGLEVDDSKILQIKPIIVSDFPVLYDLEVEQLVYNDLFAEKETKLYTSVTGHIYDVITDKIQEKIKKNPNNFRYQSILSSPRKLDPYWGFGPLFKTISWCILILTLYFLFTLFKTTTNRFMDQFSDKNNNIQPNNKYDKKSRLTFKDIAGSEEEKEEMRELIDFLKNPTKYKDMGARIPKGVLLSGPPGTGKTLLAKAVAGEAGVSFLAVSGSEFVEKYVGVGAARIRNLFKTAEQNSPCIIFIDEIETLARQRGMQSGHSEQEQTLNQLLIELDGYNQNIGVIVIAATNRPDFLDSALLRPGRFDRRFTINLPSIKDRKAILTLHASNKKLADNINLDEIAKQTPGFSGAQLEGILNEAALLATRRRSFKIENDDINEAIDRVLVGSTKKVGKYSQKEKNLVAYHEAGHAVLGLTSENGRKIHKITIIPRGDAGGYNLMLPEEDHVFLSKKQLLTQITVLLAGRASEEIFLDDISSGAHSDFQQATEIAKLMVTKYGMSDLGLVQFNNKDFSDSKALEIDQSIQNIISNCYELAKRTILDNKKLLTKIVEYLLEIETLVSKDIEEIYKTGKIIWLEEEKKRLADEKNQIQTTQDPQ